MNRRDDIHDDDLRSFLLRPTAPPALPTEIAVQEPQPGWEQTAFAPIAPPGMKNAVPVNHAKANQPPAPPAAPTPAPAPLSPEEAAKLYGDASQPPLPPDLEGGPSLGRPQEASPQGSEPGEWGLPVGLFPRQALTPTQQPSDVLASAMARMKNDSAANNQAVERSRKTSDLLTLSALLNRAGGDAGAAIARVKPDRGFSDALLKDAGDFAARATSDRDAAIKAAGRGPNGLRPEDDPNSEVSKSAQQFFIMGNQRLAEQIGVDRILRAPASVLNKWLPEEFRRTNADQKQANWEVDQARKVDNEMWRRQDRDRFFALAQASQRNIQNRFDDTQMNNLAKASLPFAEMTQALKSVEAIKPGVVFGATGVQDGDTYRDWNRLLANLPKGAGQRFTEREALELEFAVKNVRDLISRMRSGAVLNEGEERHYKDILGEALMAGPEAQAIGLDLVRRATGARLRAATASYQLNNPEAYQSYAEMTGLSFLDPLYHDSQMQPSQRPDPTQAPAPAPAPAPGQATPPPAAPPKAAPPKKAAPQTDQQILELKAKAKRLDEQGYVLVILPNGQEKQVRKENLEAARSQVPNLKVVAP